MYLNRPELLARILQANELTSANLADGGWVMTDTCNAASKYRRLLVKSINQIAEGGGGVPKEKTNVFEADKMITNFYNISFSLLILHDCDLFTIILFRRMLAISTQFLVRSYHHKSWRAYAGLDEDGPGADPFICVHHYQHYQSPV